MKKRVVITGLGAVTALGEGAGALWNAVLEGRSGISDSGLNGLPSALFKDFNAEKFITQRKSIKVMARDIQLAVAAASLAVDDAGVRDHASDRERFGLIVGSGVLNHELDELVSSIESSVDDQGKLDLGKFGDTGMGALFPLWLLKYLPNMSACHISILFDLQGPNNTLTTGVSAGLQAAGEAARIIERGAADMMLAGGAESKANPVGMAEYEVMGALSHGEYRPFDTRAKGFVVGEGAGFILFEELEHAKKRGAKIYAEVAGFGSSRSDGRESAMRAALKDAGMTPKDISFVQASGLGIAEEDLKEAAAIEAVFNGSSHRLPVTASKAVTGFTGFSAGALDLILSVLALKNGKIPATLGCAQEAGKWNFEVVKNAPRDAKLAAAMTNTDGFNGQCASMITKAYAS